MISRATNGNDTKIVASTMPGIAKTMRMSWSISHGPRIALAAEEQHEHHARDDRRYRKRQVDQRNQQLLAAKLELADRPRRGDAEEKIRRHGNRRGRQRQRQRRHGVGLSNRVQVGRPSEPERLGEDGGERHREKQAEKPQRDGGQQPSDRRRLGQPSLRIARSSGLPRVAISAPASGCSSPGAR